MIWRRRGRLDGRRRIGRMGRLVAAATRRGRVGRGWIVRGRMRCGRIVRPGGRVGGGPRRISRTGGRRRTDIYLGIEGRSNDGGNRIDSVGYRSDADI